MNTLMCLCLVLECDHGWVLHDGNCYKHFHPEKNQPDAVDDCRSMGARLAMAKTKAEGDWLRDLSGYWSVSEADPPENCQLNVKKLPKT